MHECGVLDYCSSARWSIWTGRLGLVDLGWSTWAGRLGLLGCSAWTARLPDWSTSTTHVLDCSAALQLDSSTARSVSRRCSCSYHQCISHHVFSFQHAETAKSSLGSGDVQHRSAVNTKSTRNDEQIATHCEGRISRSTNCSYTISTKHCLRLAGGAQLLTLSMASRRRCAPPAGPPPARDARFACAARSITTAAYFTLIQYIRRLRHTLRHVLN